MDIPKTFTHTLGLGLVLYGLWLLLSGHFHSPLLLSLGLVSCVAIVMIASRLDVIDHEAVPLHLKFGWFAYIGWLGREIVKSNIDVARLVLKPRLDLTPKFVWVPATQQTDMGKVIYANSITLTPGTVSVEIEQDEILVHAITAEAADGLGSGDMDRRVDEIEAR